MTNQILASKTFGASIDTTTVHAVEDVARGRFRFYETRTPVDHARRESNGSLRFHIGLRVPVDSVAALAAVARSLDD